MIDNYPNPVFYNPSAMGIPPNYAFDNRMFINQPMNMQPMKPKKPKKPKKNRSSPFVTRIPSLHLPAIILLGFSWVLHALATFLPYWSVYSSVPNSRAGLWSAQNFNYWTIQNFYFPNPNTFTTITSSIRFTSANTKGYLVTVQFLMTFNFAVMFIVLVLLIFDFILSRSKTGKPRSLLIRDYNTCDTVIIYALLLYIIYVFGAFEFAAWITYVGSRHDNNWTMHVSFAFAVIVSAFLLIIFIMYVIEFIKRFYKVRLKWEYWYGPYMEWGFFVYLTALLFLLLVICCPEWAYKKIQPLTWFAEIGLFKQCFLTEIYKKTLTTGFCTLSNPSSNQSWVDATQAFMLIAYVVGMIILVVIVIFRKEFRHRENGYYAVRVGQPTFTYIIAGLILFFCFLFTLIGVSIFGGEVFPYSIDVNWGYIVAVFSMVLFLIAGILFIMDAVHSRKQIPRANSSSASKLFFPAPLNYRAFGMKPFVTPEPVSQQIPPFMSMDPLQFGPMAPTPWQTMSPFDIQHQAMYPTPGFGDASYIPLQDMSMIPPTYDMNIEPYRSAPFTGAVLYDYMQQMQYNPQLSSFPYNEGLTAYSYGNPLTFPNDQMYLTEEDRLNEMVYQQFLQQQRLDYNHERLLERYGHISQPYTSTFGTSTLPGRNYDEYLRTMYGYDYDGNSLAAMSRAGIGASDETYRWMGGDYDETLPRDISAVRQYNRDEYPPYVYAEKIEPAKIYNHPIFRSPLAYIRSLYNKTKYSEKIHDENEVKLNNVDHKEEYEIEPTITIDNDNEISDRTSLENISNKKWKTKYGHLIPINSHLFNIYIQRLNGSIESYGQSLYLPSARHNRNTRSNHYGNIFIAPLSDTNLVLVRVSNKTSSSSNNGYDTLHSQTVSPTVSL
ncbi:unnamed protein product [Rotaria sp. Silwood1]|nr:unnamed protein product [Rotaria sp. Silwood1]CAF3492208.1 unnamed protein product [Rotaria sp. Silwood1]CAF3557605.1 unnamed protein product [Rotaria sp. Silwood1]CAF4528734.1 unnamed protein product [Rotaria sp. Silwood1]CAF4746569.1 unnamed protein product [Rotaria sp. Silwood1]